MYWISTCFESQHRKTHLKSRFFSSHHYEKGGSDVIIFDFVYGMSVNSPKFRRPGLESTFRGPLSSVKLDSSTFKKNVADTEHTSARHVNGWFQKLEPSSRLKRTPPNGAPNAADTPAAAPADTNSRFSSSQRKCPNRRVSSHSNVVDLPCDIPAATAAPCFGGGQHGSTAARQHGLHPSASRDCTRQRLARSSTRGHTCAQCALTRTQ